LGGAALPASPAATDADNKRPTLAPPAQRVITLTPHMAELVAEMGASAKLVAVSRFTDFPEALATLPQIGDASGLDFERIVALKPDLILGWRGGNRADHLERLARLGLTVHIDDQARLNDIPKSLRALGELLGTRAQAEAAARAFERTFELLRQRYASARPVSSFVEIWHQPLITVSAEHWINEVITLCGGRNIFAAARGLTPVVAMEAIYQRDPQAIVGSAYGGAEVLASMWREHSSLRAVRGGALYYVDPDLLQRPTSRLLIGAQQLCESLDRAR
jgi:iron complex transport system substrate-binding protein